MKRQNDKQEIAQLLSKFMAGETSVAEEQMLAQYFRTHEVGEDWAEYKEMFALFDSGEVDIELEADTSEQLDNGDGGKIRMLPKAVREKPKIVALRWLAATAACALLLIGFFTIKNNSESVTESPKIAQVSDSVEVKPSVTTPTVTHKETLAKTPQQKQRYRRKRSNKVKPQEANVKYMTDEMVDQLLARNHQARAQQPAADFQEVENEIKRRGEQLTNDLLAFATNN